MPSPRGIPPVAACAAGYLYSDDSILILHFVPYTKFRPSYNFIVDKLNRNL